MKIVLLVIGVLLLVPSAASAWPTPPLPDPMPRIMWERCPPPNDWAGCQMGDTIYVDDHDNLRRVMHELGHVQERRLDQGEKNRITRLFGMVGQPWRSTEWAVLSPSEYFADMYAECRVAATVRRWRRYAIKGNCRLLIRALSD